MINPYSSMGEFKEDLASGGFSMERFRQMPLSDRQYVLSKWSALHRQAFLRWLVRSRFAGRLREMI